MAIYPINITGQSYQSRAESNSNQRTVNFYADKVDNENPKSPYILLPFPGQTLFGTSNAGADRGMREHNGILYKVTGTQLFSVNADGMHIPLGEIPGTGRAIIEGIGSSIVIVADKVAYEWDGSTLTTASDVDFESPNSCAHLNNQMIYDGAGGRFGVSDVGTPLDIDGLNYASAESNADDILRVYVHNQFLYPLGRKTIEVWWNSGVGTPPLDRLEGGIITVGLGAIYSVANNDTFMYWLGDDNHIYRVESSQEQRVSNTWLHSEISAFKQISDAVGFCFNIENHNFYLLTFTGENRSFLFSENGGWTELSSGVNGDRNYANSYEYAYRKYLVSDYRNGNIYELRADVYDDVGNAIIRTRDTGPLHGALFNAPGKRLTMNSFELFMDTGQGLIEGQGKEPEVMLSYSDDGGRTFSAEVYGKVGRQGRFIKQVKWDALGSFYDRVIRVRISDPIFCAIHSASADVEVGI